jgi:hypothetical protein
MQEPQPKETGVGRLVHFESTRLQSMIPIVQVGDDASHLCPFWDLEACVFAMTPWPCDSQLPFMAVSAQYR